MKMLPETLDDDMLHGNVAVGPRDRSREMFQARRRDLMRHFRNSPKVKVYPPAERRRLWKEFEPQIQHHFKVSPHIKKAAKAFGSGPIESAPETIARVMLGETVVTNDRVLNHALQQAGNIIGRRDISALDKFEMLAAYVLKSRREILGKPED